MRKRTYDADINRVVAKTFKFLRNNGVPRHWSKTIAADTEFDPEDRFHQKVLSLRGKGVAPLTPTVLAPEPNSQTFIYNNKTFYLNLFVN